ncbi:MAG: bifunctional demethylmenaquinone methyltransferase/2-methoxy-6-polyprenyl-1,4-benzoquinol methylase UbiE [Actinobacteria bacterium]|nr:MAG: bifunctional demethylmenaquinone methyltransferase/2-methoxy-6-polyprenyl-1,4-benzoquinol methylase UbiE [Actinomycetota bacterium]
MVADEKPAPGQPTTDRVKGIFTNIAPSYDLFNILSSFGIDRLWRRATVRLAQPNHRSVMLDLAAGTGDLTMAFARLGRPASILSTDFVPEMLEVGKKKAATYEGSTKIDFAVVDAQDLPFDDERFDIVTIAFGVRNLPDRAANFREVRRVLKPGGRYVILEFTRPPSPLIRWFYHAYLRVVIPNLGGLLTGDKPSFQYLNDSIRAFPAQLALASELHAAGFTRVNWHNLTFGIVAVHIAEA